MCTVLLPPGVNPTAVKYIISYHFIFSFKTISGAKAHIFFIVRSDQANCETLAPRGTEYIGASVTNTDTFLSFGFRLSKFLIVEPLRPRGIPFEERRSILYRNV